MAAKIGWKFVCRGVARTRFGVHENRTAFRIRPTRWNRSIRKQDHAFAWLRPAQTMPTRVTGRRVDSDDFVIRCAGQRCRASRVRDLGR